MGIYIYAQDADNFDNAGLCGDLVLTKCEHEEEAGGKSVLSIAAAPDEWGKWKYIEDGCIIKAPVPVRTTPPMEGGSYVTQVVKCTVKPTSTVNQRGVYTKAVNGKRRATAKLDVEYIVVKNPAGSDRYGIKWGKGTGWIAKDAVDLGDAVTIPAAADGIESVAPAWSVRDQLFRIYDAERTDDGVTAKARHISFDLLGNLTTYETDEPVTLQTALDGILEGCDSDHDFEAFTDIDDTAAGVHSARKNPIDAFSDPEDGVIARWGAELVRDDYELYFLRRAGMNRGVRIEYGKNLKGVKCTISRDKLVTKILPVGETADGKPAYLSADPNKISATVVPESYIISPRNALYAAPHTVELPVSDAKITSKKNPGKEVTEALACERMRKAAQDMLDSGVDMPEINLEVDFLRLGDTEEYAQFAQLDDVYLYDTVRVVYKELGIDMDLDVVRVVYDCLTDRYSKIELGALKDRIVGMAGWQMPYGIDGGKIRYNSLGSGQFRDDIISARMIQAESIYTDALQARSITAEKIAADALFAQHIVAQIADIVQANINKANIGDATIDYADIVDLTAIFAGIANAQIGDADIDFAKIKDLVAGTAIISQGVGDKLYISRLAVTEANMVSLTTGELIVKGSDGRFYAVGVDAETGEVTTTLKTVEGADIENGSIDAHTKILERSITADELNVTQIFASEALIGAIKAANIAAGQITVNHLSSGVGAALDISSNETILAMVSKDTVRTMIADSTRELRVRYTGAGTHMVEATDTATLVASVFEGGFDITSTIPETAYIWTRESGDAAADAIWNAAHVGLRTITVTGTDVATRSIINCTLLAIGDVAMTFSVDPDTMLLTATEPAYGVDTATYDAATGCLTVNGEGYAYTAANQTITIDRGGLTASRTTVQYTFSDETQVRSRIQQEHDRIALVVGDGSSSTSLTLTQSFLQAVADDINLQGKVTVGWLSAEAQARIEEIESDAAAAISALVNLCVDNNLTYIDGSKIYTGSIGASAIDVTNLYVRYIRDTSVNTQFVAEVGTSKNPQSDDIYDYGLIFKIGNTVCGGIFCNSLLSDYGITFGSGDKPAWLSGSEVGILGGGGANVFFSDGRAEYVCDVVASPGNTYNLGAASGNRWRRLYTNMQPDVSSDARLKKDIAPLRVGDLIDRLIARQFRMKDDDAKLHFGFIAQEVREALHAVGINDADLLDEDNPESLALVYDEIIAVLVDAYQKLKARVGDLESRLTRLERLVDELRGVL